MALLGYYTGGVDGIWGPLSKAALQKFAQEKGPDDDAALLRAAAETLLTQAETAEAEQASGACGDAAEAAEAEVKRQEAKGDEETGAVEAAESAGTSDGTFWSDIPNFTRSEFRCPCGQCSGFPAEPQELLVREAQALRSHFGAPAAVSSGVRCPAHNAAVGGVSNSRHLTGKAVDLCVQGHTAAELLQYLAGRPNIRYSYAITGSYIHMDIL